MMHSITRVAENKYFKAFIAAVLWLAVWQAVYFAVGSDLLIASPVTVLKTLFEFAKKSGFWQSVALSILRIAAGFILGTVFGVLFAVLCRGSRLASAVLSPALKVVRATPVVSFIILAWIWIDRGFIPVFITLLMVLPIVWEAVYTGIGEIPVKYKELAFVFNIPFGKRLFKIYIPSVLPYFTSAAATSLGLAWKSGIAAEVITQPELSIGSGLYNAKIYLETGEIFAWTTVVIILSVVLEKIFAFIVKKRSEVGANG